MGMAAGTTIPLPLPSKVPPEWAEWAAQLKATLEAALTEIAAQAQTYVVSNNTGANVVRTIDCNVPVLATTTNVLATLLSDLRNKGILK